MRSTYSMSLSATSRSDTFFFFMRCSMSSSSCPGKKQCDKRRRWWSLAAFIMPVLPICWMFQMRRPHLSLSLSLTNHPLLPLPLHLLGVFHGSGGRLVDSKSSVLDVLQQKFATLLLLPDCVAPRNLDLELHSKVVFQQVNQARLWLGNERSKVGNPA